MLAEFIIALSTSRDLGSESFRRTIRAEFRVAPSRIRFNYVGT